MGIRVRIIGVIITQLLQLSESLHVTLVCCFYIDLNEPLNFEHDMATNSSGSAASCIISFSFGSDTPTRWLSLIVYEINKAVDVESSKVIGYESLLLLFVRFLCLLL